MADEAPALLPCPFCGSAAHFEMDESRWEWIECESCGMQGNRGASLMEDCKPMLRAAWNRRAPPAREPLTAEVTAYAVGNLQIERVRQRAGKALWAVRQHGFALNKSGDWEWEPMPSSRDDDFIARCRFDTAKEAIEAAHGTPREPA